MVTKSLAVGSIYPSNLGMALNSTLTASFRVSLPPSLFSPSLPELWLAGSSQGVAFVPAGLPSHHVDFTGFSDQASLPASFPEIHSRLASF